MFARFVRWYTIWIVDDRETQRPLVRLRRFRRSEYSGWLTVKYVGSHVGRAQEFAVQQSFTIWYGRISLLVVPLGFAMVASRPFLAARMAGASAPLSSPSRWLFEVTAVTVFFTFLIAITQFNLRVQRLQAKQELRTAYLRGSHCASCDSLLAGLVAEADGCVVCPKCSAAWKAESVGPQPGVQAEGRAEKGVEVATVLPGTRGERSWANPAALYPAPAQRNDAVARSSSSD